MPSGIKLFCLAPPVLGKQPQHREIAVYTGHVSTLWPSPLPKNGFVLRDESRLFSSQEDAYAYRDSLVKYQVHFSSSDATPETVHVSQYYGDQSIWPQPFPKEGVSFHRGVVRVFETQEDALAYRHARILAQLDEWVKKDQSFLDPGHKYETWVGAYGYATVRIGGSWVRFRKS